LSPPEEPEKIEKGTPMTTKPGLAYKIWTMFLSVLVAAVLFPTIVGRNGVVRSLLITALAVGAIWLMYFGISRFIEWEVTRELKRRSPKEGGEGTGGKE
jgi:uncharacterized membrane protein YjjP (DUF1212 family)